MQFPDAARVPQATRHGLRGVTLVEALVTLALLVILGALAAPTFRTQLAASRLSAATSDLSATLAQARAQAVRLGQRVTVCRSADQSTCDTAASGNWANGWIAFIDADGNGTRAAAETVTTRVSAFDPSIAIRGNGVLAQRVTFVASGGARFNGTLRVCNTSPGLANDRRARQLLVQQTGRVVVEPVNGVAPECPSP